MPKYLSTTVISILIIIAVLIPGSKLPGVEIVGFDKVVHLGMFATWAIAVRYDFPSRYKVLFIFIAGLFFSFLTEVLQLLAEGRSFDIYDMVADAVGLIIGLLVSRRILKLLGR
jgi:VanZ family protein